MSLSSEYPQNTVILFQSLYASLAAPAEARKATAHLEQLKEPISRTLEKLKARGRSDEAQRLKQEFRHLIHALNRLHTHFAGLAVGKAPLMGADEAYIYVFFAEQRYDALIDRVAGLDTRRVH